MSRRKRALHGFGDAFGALPALLALPLLAKVGLVVGAGYLLLKKKPTTVVTPAAATTPDGPVPVLVATETVSVPASDTGIVASGLRPPITVGFTPYLDPVTKSWVTHPTTGIMPSQSVFPK